MSSSNTSSIIHKKNKDNNNNKHRERRRLEDKQQKRRASEEEARQRKFAHEMEQHNAALALLHRERDALAQRIADGAREIAEDKAEIERLMAKVEEARQPSSSE
jgi:hypothetical protein